MRRRSAKFLKNSHFSREEFLDNQDLSEYIKEMELPILPWLTTTTTAVENERWDSGGNRAMKATIQRVITRPLVGSIGILVVLGCLLGGTSAEAVLIPQSASGTVEVLLAGEQAWQPLTAGMQLQAGDQIRTGLGSAVVLRYEDGSQLDLGEDTQIEISELAISPVERTRVSRIKLLWGAITAIVTKRDYQSSDFEIETDTVVAGVKFSQVTIRRAKDRFEPDHVIAEEGLIEARQIDEGTVKLSGRFESEKSAEGLDFTTDSMGATTSVRIQKLLRRVTVESNVALFDISALTGSVYKFLRLTNIGGEIRGTYQGHTWAIHQNSEAVIGKEKYC